MATRYYQLVSALPPVPYFRRAGRLPMSRRRLDQRLGLLDPLDREDLLLADALLAWSRQPVSRTTVELADAYDRAMTRIRNEALKRILGFRMNMRTVLVALRLRRRGEGPPDGLWGLGPYVRMIESRWGDPAFGLVAVFPWAPEAATYLDRGDAMELEGLLMDQSWKRLTQEAEQAPFGFEQVFEFVFKLDILARWLSYDAKEARGSFEQLILEVTREHQQLFD